MKDTTQKKHRSIAFRLKKIRRMRKLPVAIAAFAIALTVTSRVCIAYFLASDAAGDGVAYCQLAKNIVEQNMYSLDKEPPYDLTLIRMPGYPLFIAGVYSVFGHDNNMAVRVVQGVFDAATCVILALIAWLWTKGRKRKRRNVRWTFILATLCPFIAIYAAMLLTETLTTFLMAAMTLTATLAFKAVSTRRSLVWWSISGLFAGMAVLLRPDSGLFAAGIGLTIVISGMFLQADRSVRFRQRAWPVVWKCAVFSIFFMLVLTPWTIRNFNIFNVFQPLSPAHGEMPDEFVARGYQRWLRTWVDDFRFIDPTLWSLDQKPISIDKLPPRIFDSPEERDRVAALIVQYNHPLGSEKESSPAKDEADDNSGDETDSGDDNSGDSNDSSDSGDENADNSPDDNSNSDDEKGNSTGNDQEDQADDESEDDDENKKYFVKMTPEIDMQFGQIADERIARSPTRYYLFLPAKRAAALWFDSHSLYYPFGGQMSPISELDHDESQQYWLPAFTALMWVYTLLAIGGAILFWRGRSNRDELCWLILVALMTLPRILFFATVENPEPRYVVELFAFTAILGGVFLGNLKFRRAKVDAKGEPELPRDRLVSLDVFRGLTIAAMTLVNEPGTWSAVYPPLEHAKWDGATPTDAIFPFFLFIVGVSITFALGKRVDRVDVGRGVYLKIFKRSVLLFALGIFLEIFPFYNLWSGAWFEPSTTRIMGVLQRIAICYLVASLIFLRTNWKRQLLIVGGILLVYWALMTLINVPGCELTTFNDKACNLSAYLDRVILTTGHIWNQSKVFDPEGLLTTLPAIATTLAGVLAGHWLRSQREGPRKFTGMFFCGLAFAILGWVWSFWFPLNKSLWTSSYVVYGAGLALCFLAVCYWLVDLKGYRRWSTPFVIFGSNAIALYVGSTLMDSVLTNVQVQLSEDNSIPLQEKIFNAVFMPLAEPINASLLYAISFVLIWLFLMWLLYRKRMFVKI